MDVQFCFLYFKVTGCNSSGRTIVGFTGSCAREIMYAAQVYGHTSDFPAVDHVILRAQQIQFV